MMPLLRPGVRKVDSDAGQRSSRNLTLEKFHSIVIGDSDITDPMLFHLQQKVADTRLVYIHAQVVFRWMRLCHLPGRVTIAKADLHDDPAIIAKENSEIEH